MSATGSSEFHESRQYPGRRKPEYRPKSPTATGHGHAIEVPVCMLHKTLRNRTAAAAGETVNGSKFPGGTHFEDGPEIPRTTGRRHPIEPAVLRQCQRGVGSAAGEIAGNAADFQLDYDSTKYISGVALETKSSVNVDFDKLKVDITSSDVWVNRLPLQLSGSIEMPADSQIYNLQFATKSSEFENFLALVPADYAKYLENLTTSGTANVSGKITGVLFGEDYPEM